jgi:hypothetical protein
MTSRRAGVMLASIARNNRQCMVSPARIRLSDKISRLRPRHVVPKPVQAYHGIMRRIGVIGDVEVLLNSAPQILACFDPSWPNLK